MAATSTDEPELGTPHPFSVDTVDSGDRSCRLTVGGDVDIDTAPQLTEAVEDALHRGRRHIVIDMSSVTFMDSTALTAVLRGHDSAVASDGSLRLVDVSPAVLRLLELARLTEELLDGTDERDAGGDAPGGT